MKRGPLEDWAQYSQRLEREWYSHRDEIRRLRAALQQIAEVYPHSSSCRVSERIRRGDCNCGTDSTPAVSIARKALGLGP